MSFVDLATLTLLRRNELESRVSAFEEKCDHAIAGLTKLKVKAHNFVTQLNCEPTELKERFLALMKSLDEYNYLVTEFNLSISQIEEVGSTDITPVQDTVLKPLPPPPLKPYNLFDMLSGGTPTSWTCSNYCPPEKPKKIKVSKEDQLLIAFSNSTSSESVPSRKPMATKEVQCEVVEEMAKMKIEARESPRLPVALEPVNLPPQVILEVDHSYSGIIMSVDGTYIWVITDDFEETQQLMLDMTEYYYLHQGENLTVEQVEQLTYCAFYDEQTECVYRALFIKHSTETENAVDLFMVDTGELRKATLDTILPLVPMFCTKPPYARCCHFAGIDLQGRDIEKQDAFISQYMGQLCVIQVDDNSSESLGVYIVLSNNETLNYLLVKNGLADPIEASMLRAPATSHGPPEYAASDIDITTCPEYEDPVQAVTGYHNRDDADICKHYKGGPSKTCFKGSRCTKKHVMKHPDGWTLDQVKVEVKCKSLPLPEPGSVHKVYITSVCHFNRVYIQYKNNTDKKQDTPDFGVVLPPNTLESLHCDMNSPATRLTYKPLPLTPAPGELVAVQYPPDNCWYRGRVRTVSRVDQNVEVMYIDYGTVLWVKEDKICVLEPRFLQLPQQAVLCVLAGVAPRSHDDSAQWATAKKTLSEMVLDTTLTARVIARGYDEITVELTDDKGCNVAHQLAELGLVELHDYSIVDDSNVTCKVVVP